MDGILWSNDTCILVYLPSLTVEWRSYLPIGLFAVTTMHHAGIAPHHRSTIEGLCKGAHHASLHQAHRTADQAPKQQQFMRWSLCSERMSAPYPINTTLPVTPLSCRDRRWTALLRQSELA